MGTTEPEGIVGALDKLEADQKALRKRLYAGFTSTTDILLWLHKCAIHTIGEIPDGWFARVMTERYKRAALLADESDRKALGKNAPDASLAKLEREMIDDRILTPAMNDAVRVLDKQANEYGDKGAQVDPSSQLYPALRPGLLDLQTRQKTALKQALGRADDPDGLTCMSDVRSWRDSVARATRGKWLPEMDLWTRSIMTGDTDSATLHHYLGRNFLPAANAAIRETASSSEESVIDDLPNQEKFST